MGGILEEIMAQSPQTILTLFSLKSCDMNYNNVMWYGTKNKFSVLSANSQYGTKSYANLQYIRKNGYIDIDDIYDNVIKYNYCGYDNGEGSGIEYAFITEYEFLNFNCTRIYLKYDVWTNNITSQLSYKAYVERMHGENNNEYILSDNNTIPSLSTGIRPINMTTYIAIYVVFKQQINVESIPLNSNYFTTSRTAFFIYDNQGNAIGDSTQLKELISKINSAYVYSIHTLLCPSLMYSLMNKVIFTINSETLIGYNFSDSTFRTPKSFVISFSKPLIPVTYSSKKLEQEPYTIWTIKTSSKEIRLPYNRFSSTIRANAFITNDDTGVSITYIFTDLDTNTYDITDTSVSLAVHTEQWEEFQSENKTYIFRSILNVLGTAINAGGNVLSKGNNPSYGRQISDVTNVSNSIISPVLNYFDYKNKPDNIRIGDSFAEKRYLQYPCSLSSVIEYCDPSQIASIESIYDKTGYPIKAITTLNPTVRKYYTYIKTVDFMANWISDGDDRKQFEEILNNGTLIWNFSTNDAKNYGDFQGDDGNT